MLFRVTRLAIVHAAMPSCVPQLVIAHGAMGIRVMHEIFFVKKFVNYSILYKFAVNI